MSRPDGTAPLAAVLPRVSDAERARRWRLVLGGAAELDDDTDESAGRPADTDATAAADGDGDGGGRADGEGGDGGGATDDAEVDGAGPGPGTGQAAPRASDPGDPADPDTGGGAPAGPGERARGGPDPRRAAPGLRGDDARIDAALGALYDREERGSGGRRASGRRAGGLGRSRPGVVRWLGDIRRYFPTPLVSMLQRDAVEPDLGLVTLLVELNRALPDETRATARRVIAQVLERLEAELADHTRRAVRGALRRGDRTRRPRPGDIDWPHTIAANLRHWLPEHRTVVPERLVGHGRHQRSLARDVVIAVDQSGSMADSVVYASLFAGVLAKLPTLRTTFVAFDTSLTDLTPFLDDPVEVLFGVQLGGGTDIAAALGWCRRHIDRPRETVLVLISDLFEGGDGELMHRRVAELCASGVNVVVLLALSDDGAPAHDHAHAEALAALGATVTATTPDRFPEILGEALR